MLLHCLQRGMPRSACFNKRCVIVTSVTLLLGLFCVHVQNVTYSHDALTKTIRDSIQRQYDKLTVEHGPDTNLLSYREYKRTVYHKREASAEEVYNVLSEQQKEMLTCTNFKVPRDVKKITEVDYEPGPYGFDAHHKSPCWWELLSKRKRYNLDAYIQKSAMEGYFAKLRKHWKVQEKKGELYRMRCLPLLYIVGTGKCGSSDMYAMLKHHPAIGNTPSKEPRWWIRTRIGKLGRWNSVSRYIDLYDGQAVEMAALNRSRRVLVDASVGTMYIADRWMLYPGNEGLSQPRVITAHHMRATVPHAKIVILLREPVNRLYSHYKEDWGTRASPHNFHNEVVQAVNKMKGCLGERMPRECVYDPCVSNAGVDRRIKLRTSMYSIYIDDWLSIYPRENIRIYTLEEYEKNRMNVLNDLTSFLHMDKYTLKQKHIVERAAVVRRSSSKPMLGKTRRLLQDFFIPFNRQLEKILPGEDRFAFNKKYRRLRNKDKDDKNDEDNEEDDEDDEDDDEDDENDDENSGEYNEDVDEE